MPLMCLVFNFKILQLVPSSELTNHPIITFSLQSHWLKIKERIYCIKIPSLTYKVLTTTIVRFVYVRRCYCELYQ